MSAHAFVADVETFSPNGSHLHWRRKAKRTRDIRRRVAQEWLAAGLHLRAHEIAAAPRIDVTLTRVSAGQLDAEDNLPMALKPVRDQIAACLFFENDADPKFAWHYAQEKGARRKPRVRIEIQTQEAA
jgi:hypothetical protein